MKEKIVLAYSGGLDTSVLVRILTVDYGYDVIACHADVGEARDKEKIHARAKQAGAIASEVVDAKDEFVRDYCFPALRANALYEGIYPLSAALSRPLISKHLVLAAKKHGATAVAHGATGKGNDQVRFDLAVKGLAPELKIVAPQRQKNITRDEAIAYAEKHGIAIESTVKKPFSIDENLWGRSIEGGVLEDPNVEPPDEAFAWTKKPEDCSNTPTYAKVAFEKGLPTTLDGEKLSSVDLVQRIGALAGAAGVGRIDLMENRVVGIKSRENYECPAAVALITAHRDLERFTTLGAAQRIKDFLDVKFSEAVYEGLWFSPLRAALDAFNIEHSKTVTGEVTLKMMKGGIKVVGRTSPFGVYNKAMSTYDKGDLFDHRAAEGFIELAGLQLAQFSRIQAMRENGTK